MADALDRLSEWAHVNPNEQLALTCSERDPRECHRFYWLGHYLAHTTDHVIRSLTVGKEDWLPQLSDYPSFEKTQAPWLAAAVAAKVNRAA
jgi:hypothetical protein